MKTKQKFLAPIYGIRNGVKQSIQLGEGMLLRNIDLLEDEPNFFKKYDLNGTYNCVLELDYKYNEEDPSEPLPGVSLKIVNPFDASLAVYGDGRAGVAALLPSHKDDKFPGLDFGFTEKMQYEDCLDREIDENFQGYYQKFIKAYEMRPVAFDMFRRSQERFANNDKAIDSCTILESIFVPKGEKSKRLFILNGLIIMSFSKDDVILIDDLIEYRNSIIHADRAKQLKLIVERKYTYQKFEDTFKLVRKILFKYVETPWGSYT